MSAIDWAILLSAALVAGYDFALRIRLRRMARDLEAARTTARLWSIRATRAGWRHAGADAQGGSPGLPG